MRSFFIALSIVVLVDNVKGFSNILTEKENNSVNTQKTVPFGSFFNNFNLLSLSRTMVDPNKLENILHVVDELIKEAMESHEEHQTTHEEATQEFNAAVEALNTAIQDLSAATDRKNLAQKRYDDAIQTRDDRLDNLLYQLNTLKSVHGQLHTLHPDYVPPTTAPEDESEGSDLQEKLMYMSTLQQDYVINALSMFQMLRHKVDPDKLENVMGGVADMIKEVQQEIDNINADVVSTTNELQAATEDEQTKSEEKDRATERKQNAEAALNGAEETLNTHKTHELEILKEVKDQLGSLRYD